MVQKLTKRNDPSQEVLKFGNVAITNDDMSSSIFCNGGSGAGKTTGPLKVAIKSIFKLGIGALITTAKTNDRERIFQYAKETGRLDDIIVIDASGKSCINLFKYLLDLTPLGASRSISFTDLMKVVSETFTSLSEGHGDIFWVNEQERLKSHCAVLIEAAGQPLLVPDLIALIISIPTSPEMMDNDTFLSSSRCIRLVDIVLRKKIDDPEIAMAIDYFTMEVPLMADRTWSSIKSGVLGDLNRLGKGLFLRILGTEETNVTPEMTYEQQKIIVLDTPFAKFGQQGVIIQTLFVYAFMQKTLSRSLKENSDFVALISDEFQTIMSSKFLEYVSLSRSSRVINLFATQSIAACRVKIGGHHANDILEAFLGNMRIKIMMSHSEPSSNKYSSEIIGQHMTQKRGYSIGTGDGSGNLSANASEYLKYLVEPHEFALLKNGGPRNNYLCEAFITMTGRRFNRGLPYMKVAFDQRVK